MRKTTSAGYVVLAIYVDDILLTGNDEAAISTTKAYLQMHFTICDLKTLITCNLNMIKYDY